MPCPDGGDGCREEQGKVESGKLREHGSTACVRDGAMVRGVQVVKGTGIRRVAKVRVLCLSLWGSVPLNCRSRTQCTVDPQEYSSQTSGMSVNFSQDTLKVRCLSQVSRGGIRRKHTGCTSQRGRIDRLRWVSFPSDAHSPLLRSDPEGCIVRALDTAHLFPVGTAANVCDSDLIYPRRSMFAVLL